jgi:decaprenyl-phosphate phosphoribosyltransferase
VTTSAQVLAPLQLGRELLRATRPQQWVKNGLVLAAPLAAGVALRPDAAEEALATLVAMTLVAAGCYLANDVVDADLDRLHPEKRHRPVASGALPEAVALATAALLVVAGLTAAATVSAATLGVVATYAGLTLLYAVALKGVAWLELAVVASGFVLRAYAGAVATRVDASEWFLLVVSLAAVEVVASKRGSELVSSDARTRPVLRGYSPEALRRLRRLAATGLVLAYAGWAAFRPDPVSTGLALASLAAVVAVVARWSRLTEQGATGAPEQVVLSDAVVRVGTALWLVCFAATVAVVTWRR